MRQLFAKLDGTSLAFITLFALTLLFGVFALDYALSIVIG